MDSTDPCNMLKIWEVDKESSREMDSGDVCWWEGVITAQPSRSPGPVRAASKKASLSTKSRHSSSLEVLSFQPAKPPSSDRHSFWHKNKFCLTSNKPCREVCVWERNMTDNINYLVNNSDWTEVFLLHEELDVVKHCIQMYKLHK